MREKHKKIKTSKKNVFSNFLRQIKKLKVEESGCFCYGGGK